MLRSLTMIILYEYVFNDVMQYLRWRQSSVKKGKTGEIIT